VQVAHDVDIAVFLYSGNKDEVVEVDTEKSYFWERSSDGICGTI